VVATVDPRAEGRGEVPHFRSVEEAVAQVGIDAAIVATPTEMHACHAQSLVDAGVATLVEKPLAARLVDAVNLERAAARAGVLLAVGYVERFNPAVGVIRAMLRKGTLGTPIAISFRRLGLPPVDPSRVGVVHDLAVHDVDIFGLLAGADAELRGASGWPSGQVVESAHLLLEAGGVHGAVQVNWRTPVRIREFTVTTDQCYVEANYTTQKVDVVEPSVVEDFEEFSDFQSHYGSARRTQLELRQAEPLAEQLEAFVAAVQGREAPLLALARDGVESLRLADEASRRIEHG
jgi:predicted dehydrogenase